MAMMPKMTMPMATFEHDHARLPLTFMSLVSRAIRCFSQWSTMSVTCSTVHRCGASVVVACTCQCVCAVHVHMQCACVSVSVQCTCTHAVNDAHAHAHAHAVRVRCACLSVAQREVALLLQ